MTKFYKDPLKMYKYFPIRKLILLVVIVCGITALLICSNSTIDMTSTSKLQRKKIRINVNNTVCEVNLKDKRLHVTNDDNMNMIYFVTPTYPRPEQVPELLRLSHTLMHVPRIHWIVADDQPSCSKAVSNILRRTGLPYTHISSPKPYIYNTPHYPRGVSNRRAALSWIKKHINEGVLYFGDDDNTFDLQLFDEIRLTKRVSMFPVGLIGNYGVSAPIVKDGKVVGFFDSWPASRTYPVDMAGFAVNIQFMKPSSNMPYIEGYEEDLFLVSLKMKMDDIEPLADDCSKVLVWHTKTAHFRKPIIKLKLDVLENMTEYQGLGVLFKSLLSMGVVNSAPDKGAEPIAFWDHKKFNPFTESIL